MLFVWLCFLFGVLGLLVIKYCSSSNSNGGSGGGDRELYVVRVGMVSRWRC